MKLKSFSFLEFISTILFFIIIGSFCKQYVEKFLTADTSMEDLKEFYEAISNGMENYAKTGKNFLNWGWNVNNSKTSSRYILENYILPIFPEHSFCDTADCVRSYSTTDDEDYIIFKDEPEYARALINKKYHIALKTTKKCYKNLKDGLCGILVVDINNNSGNNKLGYDVFMFGFYSNGQFLPLGYNEPYESIEKNCSKYSSGRYCTAKIAHDNWTKKKVGIYKYSVR